MDRFTEEKIRHAMKSLFLAIMDGRTAMDDAEYAELENAWNEIFYGDIRLRKSGPFFNRRIEVTSEAGVLIVIPEKVFRKACCLSRGDYGDAFGCR